MTTETQDEATSADPTNAGEANAGGMPRVAEFDPSEESATGAVVAAVAAVADTPPTALDPLYGVVDSDALDALFDSLATRSGPAEASVSLRYHGYLVTVRDHGVVEVADLGAD